MCERIKTGNSRIDPCIKELIKRLNFMLDKKRFKIVASCCGHYKYRMSIVIYDIKDDFHFELLSGEYIPRKRRFYKRDSDGWFFIPEADK